MEDIKADLLWSFADLIILAETWLYDETDQEDQSLYLKDTTVHFNSKGRGKGLAVYIRNNIFNIVKEINNESLQMTLLKSQQLYVLGLYRSKPDKILSSELCRVIPANGPCLVIGDFNICSQKRSNHQVFNILRSLGFNLLLHEATHFEGGHLDQAWIRNQNSNLDIELYSPYYNCKDHDALLFTIFDPSTEKGESC